ncbi:MAG: glutamate synthase, partial [Fidelibacterota bacterium]
REVIPAGTTDDLRPLSLKFRRKAVEIPHMEEFNGHEGGSAIFSRAVEKIRDCEYEDFSILCGGLVEMSGESDECKGNVIEALTLLRDRRYDPGRKKLCWLLSIIDNSLKEVLSSSPPMGTRGDGKYVLINYTLKGKLDTPSRPDQVLIVDSMDFKSEGVDSVSELMVRAYKLGWRNFIIYNTRGDRFIGCGLGPDTTGVRIDVYGNPGDYLGSGIDGAELYVHANAQDQVGQILNSGKIVIFGNVGQTFLYGAKGGSVYVMGNTAGRPLINSVGRIRAVINGTCLDYAAESFMAGDELDGGFIIINGLRVNPYGEFIGLEEKFPGCNFFSLASGGAGYLNDPYHTVTEDQLNGAEFTEFTQQDWNVIEPYLKENQKLFGIMIDRDILTVDRTRKWPGEVYRKVVAARITMAPR